MTRCLFEGVTRSREALICSFMILVFQCRSVSEPNPNSWFAVIFSLIFLLFQIHGQTNYLDICLLDNENRSPLKSPQKQHDSVSKSPLQDRTNIQTTPNNLVKRKLQSDGILHWFLVYLCFAQFNSLMVCIICQVPEAKPIDLLFR